jgi:amino acid permease
MFGMMASALGTGIFNLPLRITEIGIVIFIAYVLLAGIFSYLGCILLQKMIAARGFDSYSEICENAYGVAMKRLAQFCLVVFPWGITICYQVIMPKFIIQLLADVFDLDLY